MSEMAIDYSGNQGFLTDADIAALGEVGVEWQNPGVTKQNAQSAQNIAIQNNINSGMSPSQAEAAYYAAQGTSRNGTAVQTFVGTLGALMPTLSQDIINELWGAYAANSDMQANPNTDLSLVPQMLIGSEFTPLFNAEFKGYLDIRANKQNVTGITSLTDFIQARNSYRDLMTYYGLKDMGTNENIDKFISGNVSVAEAQARMQAAYEAVMGADSVLRSQLGALNLSDGDLVKALLLGPDGKVQLENKIKTANINAAEVEAGIKSILGASDLALQGVTREQARQGLSVVKQATPGYQAAAARALQSPTDMQKQLEQEQLLGMKSAKRAKLSVREQGLIAGKSGVTTGSLNRSASGKF